MACALLGPCLPGSNLLTSFEAPCPLASLPLVPLVGCCTHRFQFQHTATDTPIARGDTVTSQSHSHRNPEPHVQPAKPLHTLHQSCSATPLFVILPSSFIPPGTPPSPLRARSLGWASHTRRPYARRCCWGVRHPPLAHSCLVLAKCARRGVGCKQGDLGLRSGTVIVPSDYAVGWVATSPSCDCDCPAGDTDTNAAIVGGVMGALNGT